MQNRMLIEIAGVYDGTCLIYYPKEKRFEWLSVAICRTTAEYRKDFEKKFLEDLDRHTLTDVL